MLAKLYKLHKSRPEKLVITLSICDIIFLDQLITYIILKEFDTKLCKTYTNAFLCVRNLTHISYFLIELKRPNATYAVEITVKRGMYSVKEAVIGCFVCYLDSVPYTLIEKNLFQISWSVWNTSDSRMNTLLCVFTILMYLILSVRIYNRQDNRPGSSCNTLPTEMTINATRTRSVVMSITLFAYILSCIMSLPSIFFRRTETISSYPDCKGYL